MDNAGSRVAFVSDNEIVKKSFTQLTYLKCKWMKTMVKAESIKGWKSRILELKDQSELKN